MIERFAAKDSITRRGFIVSRAYRANALPKLPEPPVMSIDLPSMAFLVFLYPQARWNIPKIPVKIRYAIPKNIITKKHPPAVTLRNSSIVTSHSASWPGNCVLV